VSDEQPSIEAGRMLQMQAITIQALQQRIYRLEMEIVDLMSASMGAAMAQESMVKEGKE